MMPQSSAQLVSWVSGRWRSKSTDCRSIWRHRHYGNNDPRPMDQIETIAPESWQLRTRRKSNPSADLRDRKCSLLPPRNPGPKRPLRNCHNQALRGNENRGAGIERHYRRELMMPENCAENNDRDWD